jgi:hypothetical protein
MAPALRRRILVPARRIPGRAPGVLAAALALLIAGAGGGAAAAPPGPPASAPSAAPAPLRVVVFGDTRAPLPGERSRAGPVVDVIAAVAREHPALAFHTGDFVTRGASRSGWRHALAGLAPLKAAGVHLYPVLGNHEYFDRLFLRSRKALRGYFQSFDFPRRDAFGRPLPAVDVEARPPRGPRWYSVLKAGALFLVLDSNVVDDQGGVRLRTDLHSVAEWDEQMRFVRDHLVAADRDPRVHHVFVLLHHPIYTRSTGHPSARPLWDYPRGTPAERQARTLKHWLDQSRKLRAVLAGHVHNYERYVCERDGLPPVIYAVVGGGGAPGRPRTGPPPGARFGPLPPLPNSCAAIRGGYRATTKAPDGVPVWGYLRLTVTPAAVAFEMVPVANGQPPDRFRIEKTARGARLRE